MIACKELCDVFKKNNMDFFTGVPDSTFGGWINFLKEKSGKGLTHIIAPSECEAIAIASGHHLATGKIGVVYMQNSGFGKTINPLTSLADKEVYSIPMLLIIGWRGQMDKKDEPQHKKIGRITIPLLNTLELYYHIMPETKELLDIIISDLVQYMKNNSTPCVLMVPEGTIEKYSSENECTLEYGIKREDAIKIITSVLGEQDVIVSTTGKTSRELFEYRMSNNEKPRDFYTVGSMGCASSIGLGIALHKPNKKVFVFDGDGAAIMQLGALTSIGHYKPENFYHIIFDNECHDSTGGQPTVSSTLNFGKIALACGYNSARIINNRKELENTVREIKNLDSPCMIVVKVDKGARPDLGRPTTTPEENKKEFIRHLNKL